MGYEKHKALFGTIMVCVLTSPLITGMNGGCAGTQESEETVEPNSPGEEKTSEDSKVEKAQVEEITQPEIGAETQVGASSGENQVTCGDPSIAAKYNDCKVAKEESSCVAAGGRWTRIGLSPVSMCLCSTGQEECPCETSADCLSTCIAPLDLKNWDCSPKRHCSAVDKTAGCWCRYHEDGSVRKMCVD